MKTLACVAVLGLAAVTAEGRAEAPTSWTLSSVAPEGSSIDGVLRSFVKGVEKASKGQVRGRVRLGGVLGDEISTLDLLRQNKVQVWAGSLGAAAARFGALGALELPYLFADLQDMQRIERMVVAEVSRLLEPEGITTVGLAFVGWRGVSSREKPIRRPEDLRGLRVRSQHTPMHLAMWKRLGTTPQVMELPDLGLAFSSKLIDVFDVPPAYIFATSLGGRVKHYTRTEHMMQLGLVLASKRAVDAQPALAEFVRRTGGEMSRTAGAASAREETDLLRQLGAAGTAVISLDAGERKAWRDALAPLGGEVRVLAGPSGEALLGTVQAARKRAK